MKKRPVEDDIDFKKLAKITENYSAADIVQICEEATDIPLKDMLLNKRSSKNKNWRKINMGDFISVIEKRKSSLTNWFNYARQEITESGESETFRELSDMIKKHTEKKFEGHYYR